MGTNVIERARRYVGRMDAAIEGSGGHTATFKVAVALIKGFGLDVEAALPILEEYNGRCVPPWCLSDLRHKLVSAEGTADRRPRGYLLEGSAPVKGEDGVAPVPRGRPVSKDSVYDLAKLQLFASGCRAVVDRVWLAERSPVPVEWGNRRGLALDVLNHLFEPEDVVLLFKRRWNQGDFAVWRRGSYRLSRERGVSAVVSEIPTESNDGMLLMAAPVDGRWRPGGRDKEGRPKFSRRNTGCVTRFPYLVLESDVAPVDLWLRALALLDLRIAAVFSSGGRSVHALVRVDAGSKSEFDECARVVAGVLEPIGADVQSLKGLPMSRVPGVKRLEKGGVQELWYLDPDPGWGRLFDVRSKRVVGSG